MYVSLCDWSAVKLCGDLQDYVLEGLVGSQRGISQFGFNTPSFRTGLPPPRESVIVIQAFTPYNILHILAHILTHLDQVPPDQRQKQKQGTSGMAATKPWTLVFGEAVIRMLQCRLKALRRLFQRQPERFPSRTVSTTTVLWTVIGFLFCPKADVYLRKACIRHSKQTLL